MNTDLEIVPNDTKIGNVIKLSGFPPGSITARVARQVGMLAMEIAAATWEGATIQFEHSRLRVEFVRREFRVIRYYAAGRAAAAEIAETMRAISSIPEFPQTLKDRAAAELGEQLLAILQDIGAEVRSHRALTLK